MSGDKRVGDGVGEDHDRYEESACEVARRLYGRSLEPRNRRELERSLEAWRELGSADRTFVLAHLGMLRLRALEEVLDRDWHGGAAANFADLAPDDEATEEVIRPRSRVG